MCYTESNSGTWHFCGIFPAMEQKVEGWVIMKKILFVASEAVPFIKTGGLADVVGSLPKCFDKEYFDVRVMIPKYLCIKDKFLSNLTYVNHFYMDYLGQSRYVGILEYVYEGITFYFIDNESYFWGDKPYGDWYYDLEKFSFFSQAALSALPVIGWRPDVIHCHDWQTGLIPVYLKGRFGEGEFFRGIKSVMTIHNLKFQGVWDVKTIQRFSGLPDYFFTPDKLEAYKDGNMLKGGLVYADAITTVRMMVRVPSESVLTSGRTEQSPLAAKLTSTQAQTTLLFLAGGTMMARNMPNSATDSALTTRAGRVLPAVTPSAVPMAQPGMAGMNAP